MTTYSGRVLLGHLHRDDSLDDVANVTVLDYYHQDVERRVVTISSNRLWTPTEGRVLHGRPETLLEVGAGFMWCRLSLEPLTADGDLPCDLCEFAGHLPCDAYGFAYMPDVA